MISKTVLRYTHNKMYDYGDIFDLLYLNKELAYGIKTAFHNLTNVSAL